MTVINQLVAEENIMLHSDFMRARPCSIENCDNEHIPNLPLLRKIVDDIKSNPKEWNQNHWAIVDLPDALEVPAAVLDDNRQLSAYLESTGALSCGTAYCIAGNAAVMSGHQLIWSPEDTFTEDGIAYIGGILIADQVSTFNKYGRHATVSEIATHELGLNASEADALFDGYNTIERIQEICAMIAQRAGEEF